MAISNVTYKNIISLAKKVESSFNSSKDRESNNFYQRDEKKYELPSDLDELFEFIQKEVKKFQESDFAKKTGLIYLTVKEDKKVFVIVKNITGNVLRKIPPIEFLELTKTTTETKGGIINSVY